MSELNKAKPEVYLDIGGKARKLIFNLWSKASIIEDRGQEFLSKIDYKKLTVLDLTILLWSCLLDGSPELDGVTVEKRRNAQKEVSKWLEELTSHNEVVANLFQAIINSLPDQKDKEKEEGEEADKKKSEQQSN